LTYWARLGRAISNLGVVSRGHIDAARSGLLPLDELTEAEGLVFNAETDAAIIDALEHADFGQMHAAEGITTVALDADGRIVEYRPDVTTKPLDPHEPANEAATGVHDSSSTEPVLPFADGWPASIDVGPGWYPIVTDLAATIEDAAPGTTYRQVKEKMGGLRVYLERSGDADTDRMVEELIMAAEMRAGRTCDVCGQPGSRQDRPFGLHVIRCDEHI
jgi:hypothetical protein